jgi:hypothetical protein
LLDLLDLKAIPTMELQLKTGHSLMEPMEPIDIDIAVAAVLPDWESYFVTNFVTEFVPDIVPEFAMDFVTVFAELELFADWNKRWS